MSNLIPQPAIGAGSMSIGDAPTEPTVEFLSPEMPPRDELRTRARRYELPIAKTYVQRWGLPEAAREIIQNAIDSDSPFEHELRAGRLVVRSRNSVLSPKSLLLGTTSKAADDEKIGSFGEGYKIALLVLLRSGYQVVVRNGDRIWTPEFAYSHVFGDEVLAVRDDAAPEFHEGLAFEVSGLTPADEDAVRECCLLMQPAITDAIDTEYGRILPTRGGKLYVGGLFVCKTGLNYGYDMKPQFVKLERDRQTVDEFDLTYHTTKMWMATGRWDQVAAMMKADAKDLAFAEYSMPPEVREACARLFKGEYAGKVVAKSQTEADSLVRRGIARADVVQVPSSSGYYAGIKAAPTYQASIASRPIAKTPAEILSAWLEQQRPGLGAGAISSFEDVIREASKWSLA